MNEREQAKASLLTLAHDVGKYVVRTARNIETDSMLPLPEPILRMLIADLYEGRDGQRASLRFDQIVSSMSVLRNDMRLIAVRQLLTELDACEAGVRSQDSVSIRTAIDKALRIDSVLREVVAQPSGRNAPQSKRTTK